MNYEAAKVYEALREWGLSHTEAVELMKEFGLDAD